MSKRAVHKKTERDSEPFDYSEKKTSRPISRLKLALFVLIPAIIIAAILIWYLAFFTDKNKAVEAALYNLLSNRDNTASFDISINDNNGTASYTGSVNFLASGSSSSTIATSQSAPGVGTSGGTISTVSRGSDLYIRFDQPSGTTNGIDFNSLGLVDTWVKITGDDVSNQLTSLSPDGTEVEPVQNLQCLQAASDELDDKSSQKQVVEAILHSGFISINNSGTDDNGKYYELSIDGNHYDEFLKQLYSTNVSQTYITCLDGGKAKTDADEALDQDELEETGVAIDESKISIRLWIDDWTRNITRFDLTVEGKNQDITATINLTNKAPHIEIPNNATTLEDLIQTNLSAWLLVMNHEEVTEQDPSKTN